MLSLVYSSLPGSYLDLPPPSSASIDWLPLNDLSIYYLSLYDSSIDLFIFWSLSKDLTILLKLSTDLFTLLYFETRWLGSPSCSWFWLPSSSWIVLTLPILSPCALAVGCWLFSYFTLNRSSLSKPSLFFEFALLNPLPYLSDVVRWCSLSNTFSSLSMDDPVLWTLLSTDDPLLWIL